MKRNIIPIPEISQKKLKLPFFSSSQSYPYTINQQIHYIFPDPDSFLFRLGFAFRLANLSDLDTYIKLNAYTQATVRQETENSTVYNIMTEGGYAFENNNLSSTCIALESLKDKKVFGFVSFNFRDQEIVILDYQFTDDCNYSIDHQKLFLLDILFILLNKQNNVFITLNNSLRENINSELLNFLQSQNLLSTFRDNKLLQNVTIKSIGQKIFPELFSKLFSTSTYSAPALKPGRFFHLSTLPHKIEDLTGISRFPISKLSHNPYEKLLEAHNLRIIIPNPDQLLAMIDCYTDFAIRSNEIKKILRLPIENPQIEIYAWGLQDISSQKIIGSIFFNIRKNDKLEVEITNLFIDHHYQSHGYGSVLLMACIQNVKSHCKKITLNSSGEGVPLYRSYGFVPQWLDEPPKKEPSKENSTNKMLEGESSDESSENESSDDEDNIIITSVDQWKNLPIETIKDWFHQDNSCTIFELDLTDANNQELFKTKDIALREKLERNLSNLTLQLK